MINLLRRGAAAFEALHVAEASSEWRLPSDAVWIDLVSPTREEELAIEQAVGLDLPTAEEMLQIEPSSRLYQEGDATFMTASLLVRSDDDQPRLSPVTFVLAAGRLLTIRYDEAKAFSVFAQRAVLSPAEASVGGEALMGLLDAVIERLAEVLERGSEQVQVSSTAIFNRPRGAAFEPLLTSLARTQSMVDTSSSAAAASGTPGRAVISTAENPAKPELMIVSSVAGSFCATSTAGEL